MGAEDRGGDHVAICAAFLSPAAGLPLIGPWVVHAILPEESRARPHAARAFDLQLFAVVFSVAVFMIDFLVWGFPLTEFIVGTFLILMTLAHVVLMVGALRRSSWADAWEPFVLGGRKLYEYTPFIRTDL